MRFVLIALATGVLLAACAESTATVPSVGVTLEAIPAEFYLTATALPTEPPPTATPEPTPEAPAPTETAIIRLAPPTAPPVIAPVVVPTATAVPAEPPPAAPIKFFRVRFVSAVHDQTRPPNGSINTMSVEFTGSRPPFSVRHDEMVGAVNANGDGTFIDSGATYTFIFFQVKRTCGGPIPGTVTVIGGDGQSFTQAYYVNESSCP